MAISYISNEEFFWIPLLPPKYAILADTASYAFFSETSSITLMIVVSSSHAETSSYAIFSETASFVLNSSGTSSYAISASHSNVSDTASFVLSSSYAISASHANISDTSSYVEFSNVAHKPTLISSSLQFTINDKVTFGEITSSKVLVSGSLRLIGEAVISGSLTVSSSATFHNIGNAIFDGPITASNISSSGNISASRFIGDGSGITGVISSSFASTYPIQDTHIIRVYKTGSGEVHFNSVKAAIDSITSANIDNPYSIEIGPGNFIEDTIVMKPYVSIVGSGEQSTYIIAKDSTQIIISGSDFSQLERVVLTGASGSGGHAVYHESPEGTTTTSFKIKNVLFGNNDTHLRCHANTSASSVLVSECKYGGIYQFNKGFIAENNPIYNQAGKITLLECTSNGMTAPYPIEFARAQGTGCEIVTNGVQIRTGGVSSGSALKADDGARLRLSSTNIRGWSRGIQLSDTGSAPSMIATAISFENNTRDLVIQNSASVVNFQGLAARSKVDIIPDANALSLIYLDTESPSTVMVGDVFIGEEQDQITDMTEIWFSQTQGLIDGGELTISGGFVLNIASGSGYVEDSSGEGFIKSFYFDSGSLTLPPSSSEWIYVNNNGIFENDPSFPNTEENILLGRVYTNSSSIEFIDNVKLDSNHLENKFDHYFREVFGSLFASGGIVSSISRSLSVNAAVYYNSGNRFHTSGLLSGSNFREFYRSGSDWKITNKTLINNTDYDDGSGTLIPLSASYYSARDLYLVGEGLDEKYMLVIGQSQHNTQSMAESSTIMPPDSFTDGVIKLARIIINQASASVIEILDQRPRPAFSSAVTQAVVTDHGDLSGLLDDDHPQYLLTNGGRIMTGDLNIGGNNIVNASLVDGVNVPSHSSRHLPNGSDPLATAAPTTDLSAGTTNTVGVNNSFARSDHTHKITTSSLNTPNSIVARDSSGNSVFNIISASSLFLSDGSSMTNITASGKISASGGFIGDGSNVTGVISSSYSISSSHSTDADTASFVQNSISSSYSLSSSYSVSSSHSNFSDTASYVTLSQTASLANSVAYANITGKPTLISSSLQFTSNDNVTFGKLTASIVSASILIGDGTNVTGVISASHANNSDTSSFVILSQTASYVTLAQTASFVLSSSYALSSSYSVTSSNANSVAFVNITGKPTLISSSLQFKNTDDVRFRNLTASVISSSNSIQNNVTASGVISASGGFVGDGTNITGIISASHAINSDTASFVLSSSYSISSSHSNLSDTASYVTLSQTASLANSVAFANITGKPTLVSSSLQFKNTDDVTFRNITASVISSSGGFIGDGSNVTGVISSSYSISSSHSNLSDTASFVITAQTASFVAESNISVSDFIFSFDTTTQSISSANAFQTASFNTNNQLNGWTHVVGTGNFTCNSTAKYQLVVNGLFTKTGGGNGNVGMRALFNSNEISGSYCTTAITSNNSPIRLGTAIIFDATSSQNLQIQFASDTAQLRLDIPTSIGSPTIRPSIEVVVRRL